MSRLKTMFVFVLSIAMVALFGFVSGSTATAQPQPGVGKQNVVQVQGTGPNGEKFNGQFQATSAKEVAKHPNPADADANGATSSETGTALTGALTGKLVSPGQPQPGNPPGQRGAAQDVNIQNFSMPVTAITFPQQGAPSAWSGDGQDNEVRFASQQQTCTVLDLTLGPLHLNLLGLIIDLNQVHLVITAQPSGGILGQLLCSLAGPGGIAGGTLQQIINLLQQILAALGG